LKEHIPRLIKFYELMRDNVSADKNNR